MKRLLAGSVAALLALPVLAAAADPPKVTITLNGRKALATPQRCGCTHTGGGNIDVAQPSPDVVVITLGGVAVATGHPCGDSVASMNFDLEQCFEIAFDDPKLKAAKLTIEGRVIGLLRSHCKGGGSAQVGEACASVGCGDAEMIAISLPAHSVCGGENLSVNDRQGPCSVPVAPGCYTLRQGFSVQASHARCVLPCKAASAEFAPDPALDPFWISYKEPFHGAVKKDYGFQITITVAPDNGVEEEKKPNGAKPPDAAKPNATPPAALPDK